jgi:hypothetical protein
MRRSHLFLVALLLAACDGGPTESRNPPVPGITPIQGHDLTDTVDARPVSALTVQVLTGKPAVAAANVVVRFESGEVLTPGPGNCSAGCSTPSMRVSGLTDTLFRTVATATTNAEGKASVRTAFGTVAGPGSIIVTVPELGMQDTVRYTVQPGAGTRVRLMPQDTVIYIGTSFTARPAALDRYGNARPEVPGLSGPGLGIDGRTVTGSAYGAYRLRASMALGADSIAVTVMPRGTIAYGFSWDFLSVRDLDGSGAATYRITGDYDGFDWSRDGSKLYFTLRTLAGFQLHTVGSSGVQQVPLTRPTPNNEYRPQVHGDWLYFVREYYGPSFEIAVTRVREDGTGLEKVHTLTPYSTSWYRKAYGLSPDLSKIVTAEPAGLTVTDLATRQTRVIASRVAPSGIRWSPDGRWIAFSTFDRVEVVSPDGAERKTLIDEIYHRGFDFDWSPDGKWLIYEGRGVPEIAQVDTDVRIPLSGIRTFTHLAWRP